MLSVYLLLAMSIATPRFDSFQSSSKRASKIATRIRSTDSNSELRLRRAVWKLGLRFRKHVKALPGKPDIVFPREAVAVFCDGDFWHGRNWPQKKERMLNGSNSTYWVAKIEANIERDRRYTRELNEQSWRVLRYWESDILDNPNAVAHKIRAVVLARRKQICKAK